MASVKIKIAREGMVAKALRNSVLGTTTGGTTIYEIHNVPDDVNVDQLIALVSGFDAPKDRFQLQFSELPAKA